MNPMTFTTRADARKFVKDNWSILRGPSVSVIEPTRILAPLFGPSSNRSFVWVLTQTGLTLSRDGFWR